jgi:SAM-dependent methyltransferase
MGVKGVPDATAASPPAQVAFQKVVWHDLECGWYEGDLALWRELAGQSAGPILEVGAGTGRVALDLARAGHRVTALDIESDLLCAVAERAGGGEVETICADARSFELGRSDFGLCIVAMQSVQLFGGAAGRGAFLRRARAHLRPGGLLACAIVTAPETFDCADGPGGPFPETVRVEDALYVSRATRVKVLERSILIEREHRVLLGGEHVSDVAPQRDVIELDRVSVAELEREGVEAGLRAFPARELAPTEEHVGSTVVILGA